MSQPSYEAFKLPYAGFVLSNVKYTPTPRGVAYTCQVEIDSQVVGQFANRGDGGFGAFYSAVEHHAAVGEFLAKHDVKSVIIAEQPSRTIDQVRDQDAMVYLIEAELSRLDEDLES